MGWIHYFSPFLPASSVAVVRLNFLSYIKLLLHFVKLPES